MPLPGFWFARRGSALAGEKPEHARIAGSV